MSAIKSKTNPVLCKCCGNGHSIIAAEAKTAHIEANCFQLLSKHYYAQLHPKIVYAGDRKLTKRIDVFCHSVFIELQLVL